MKAIYTILTSAKENLLVMYRNNHDFLDKDGKAPQPGEQFFMLFTEPWMAVDSVKPGNALCIIDTEQAWDFYRGMAQEVGKANRALVNKCIPNAKPHEMLYCMPTLLPKTTLEDFLKNIYNVDTCEVCYSKDIFIQTKNMNKSIPTVRMKFDE